MAGGYMFRFYFRVVIVGLWGLLVGVTVVGVTWWGLLSMPPGDGDRGGLLGAGISLLPLVVGVLGSLMEAGMASLGLGAVLMTVGARMCVTAV